MKFIKYLELYDDGIIDKLWTPFDEVKLLGSGLCDEKKRISDKFMSSINIISIVEDVTGKLIEYYWIDGIERKIRIRPGKFYKLNWEENIWNNTEKLQPYYNFISKIKLLLHIITGEKNKWVDNGFEFWTTPSHYYYRTLDSIYLELDDDDVIDRLLGSGNGHENEREQISNKFMIEINNISIVENVTGKLIEYYWLDPEVCKIKTRPGKFYKLTWEGNKDICSYKIFSSLVRYPPNRDKKIFKILSGGKNTF